MTPTPRFAEVSHREWIAAPVDLVRGTLRFRCVPATIAGCTGTEVDITIRLPLPPVIGPLLRPLQQAQVRRERRAAALEDKRDIERGGYSVAGSAPVAA